MFNLNNIVSSSWDLGLFSGYLGESSILGLSENYHLEALIPYRITPSITNAQKILNKMIDYLPEKNPIKFWLLSKFAIANLLEPLPTYTELLSQPNLLVGYENIVYDIKDYSNLGLRRSPGVYLYFCNSTKSFYIGSTTCFLRRYQQHITNSYKNEEHVNTRFYQYLRTNGNWTHFSWVPLYSQVELVNLFILENKGVFLSSQELFILRAFSQFQIRIIEQALITHYKPNLVTQNLV